MIIGGQEAEVFRPFAESLLGPLKGETLLVANINGQACGVVCLTMWGARDCEISAAATGPGWVYREFCEHIADVVYNQNGCARLTAKIVESNRKSRAAAMRAGFRHEGTMREASDDGENIHIYGMLKEECKWLRPQE